jgi:hypothetical protein
VAEEEDNGLCRAWVAVPACSLRSHDHDQEGVAEDSPETPLEKEAFDNLEEGSHSEHLEGDNVPDHHAEVNF